MNKAGITTYDYEKMKEIEKTTTGPTIEFRESIAGIPMRVEERLYIHSFVDDQGLVRLLKRPPQLQLQPHNGGLICSKNEGLIWVKNLINFKI